ncbi:MAG: radical SAM protein [Bacteroidetes bacterium HGW-Bacteroidetes-21]|nr:MAG: radical SAM protein [Bacteroidetes bacterium HGW-Bacteroidetes-21]
MHYFPIHYNEPLFRPPAEAYSVIFQITLGCSWNKCTFCEMYQSKKFRVRKTDEVFPEIETMADFNPGVKRIFLADGNAFVLSAEKLIPYLDKINQHFKGLQRISSYALPSDILAKSSEELIEIRNKGLKLLYIGIESGDNDVLKMIHKSETHESMTQGILKAQAAGFDTSIMILNGLGGKKYSRQHALNSAKIINAINPKFLSTLTLSFPHGSEHFKEKLNEDFQALSVKELFEELKIFIENIDTTNVIFRSNHVSNNINLNGTLSKDKEALLETLARAIAQTPEGIMPPDYGFL